MTRKEYYKAYSIARYMTRLANKLLTPELEAEMDRRYLNLMLYGTAEVL